VPFPGAARCGDRGGRVIAAHGKRDRSRDRSSRIVSTFAAGSHPSSIAVADLDGDGNLDLAIANHEQKSLTLAFATRRAYVQVAVRKWTPHCIPVAAADLGRRRQGRSGRNDMEVAAL